MPEKSKSGLLLIITYVGFISLGAMVGPLLMILILVDQLDRRWGYLGIAALLFIIFYLPGYAASLSFC